MSNVTRIWIGRSMAAVGIVSTLIGWGWMIVTGQIGLLHQEWLAVNGTVSIAFGSLSWAVLPRQPRNGALWPSAIVSLTSGLFCLGAAAVFAYGAARGFSFNELISLSPSDLPTGIALVLMMVSWLFLPVILVFTVGLLLFPDGRPPSRRWLWVKWVAYGGVAVESVALTWLYRPSSELTFDLARSNADFLTNFGPFVAVPDVAQTAMIPLAVAALVIRFRRSAGVERQQFRIVVWGGAVAGLLIAVSFVGDWVGTLDPRWPVLLAVIVMAMAYGVSIAKYRLYDVDIVISRTLVLAVLAGFITIIYAAVVVGLGQLIGGESDEFLLPILATAVVAFAFEPVRQRAQKWANRLVFGNRATPYEVLSDLTERLSGAEEGGGILARMAELLQEGTGAERATVWLGDRGSMVPAATAPIDAVPSEAIALDEEAGHVVTHDGGVVGALEVVKPRGTSLSTAERSLVADLAGSAGAVLGYQRLNDSLSQRATELEESRTRLLGVQDAERRRLEQDLHEGAEQFIVALKVKLGVASQLAARAGNEKLEDLLADLTDEAQAALDDVQSLAKGIYPPVLESDGLGAAVSALASSTPVDVHFDRDGDGRYPAEVEAAVYFGVSEAVTNAVKHAHPPIRITLVETDGLLRFSVTDDGPGFDIDDSDMGSGLENMADRIESVGGALRVNSAIGTGTEVSGTIPVSQSGT